MLVVNADHAGSEKWIRRLLYQELTPQECTSIHLAKLSGLSHSDICTEIETMIYRGEFLLIDYGQPTWLQVKCAGFGQELGYLLGNDAFLDILAFREINSESLFMKVLVKELNALRRRQYTCSK